jgi:hypothetical protein
LGVDNDQAVQEQPYTASDAWVALGLDAIFHLCCKQAADLEEFRTLTLMELLVRMGFPFAQCHQPWVLVGPGMRSRLGQFALTFYDSVIVFLSVADAVLAMLDVPGKEETAPMVAGRRCQYNLGMHLSQASHIGCCAHQH